MMTEKIEDVALVLLPLFFVFTGLRTEISLLNTPHLWGICALFIVVSIADKMIGATFSAGWSASRGRTACRSAC